MNKTYLPDFFFINHAFCAIILSFATLKTMQVFAFIVNVSEILRNSEECVYTSRISET